MNYNNISNTTIQTISHYTSSIWAGKRLKNEICKWLNELMIIKPGQPRVEYELSLSIGYHGKESLVITILRDDIWMNYLEIIQAVPGKKQGLTLLFSNQNELFIEFEIGTKGYPFSPPQKVEINGIEYLTLLRIDNRELNKLGIDDTKCLCCESLLCKNNWGPNNTISNLLDEIQHNLHIKKAVTNNIICNVIKRKYLIDDIPIMDFLY
jgi:hypothetical protein